MDGEAEPTMRLHLHVSHAVQGELFPSADAQPVTRGYRGTVASKVAGITYRQLDYWARKQIVEPSITPSQGSGSRRLYSFKDVVILAVSKRLLDAGINWYEAKNTMEFYLLEGRAVEILITSLTGKGNRIARIVPEELQEGIIRLRISVEMRDDTHLKVELEDLGFGTFRAATHHIWKEEIEL